VPEDAIWTSALATGVDPYFVGKPNPLMIRSALNALDAHSESTAMIGDRMDRFTGVTSRADAERHPYRPARIVESVAELIDELG
jgi:NagD protein